MLGEDGAQLDQEKWDLVGQQLAVVPKGSWLYFLLREILPNAHSTSNVRLFMQRFTHATWFLKPVATISGT